MTTEGTNPSTSGEEPELTPPPPPPVPFLASEFMSSVMARLSHQEEVQKTTNDQLAAIVAAFNAPASNSQPLRRYLFSTNPPTTTDGVVTNEVEQIGTLAADVPPVAKHNPAKQSTPKNTANAHVEPRQHAATDKNNRKNGLLYVVDENGKKWNTFHRETDSPSESHQATSATAAAQSDLEEAPESLDLRTLLKRKTTPNIIESPGPSDLRSELNAKRSKHTSQNDALVTDLREQLNARYIDISVEAANFVIAVSEATPQSAIDGDTEMTDQPPHDWRAEFIQYLTHGTVPADKWAARRLKRPSAHYVIMEDELHRVTAIKVLLKCIFGEQARLVMAEPHEGAGGNHSGGWAFALKNPKLRILLANDEY
ncbi:hypothetical protein Bca52824_026941 [Brassica carinata]|uniref:Uncharacterized protein n=1 Tax=Brassica carinata TaxID=52824 RepID=A0A8X7SHH3_BRACI|nr:hypothetical protein Bca52824_026941 [Brassica carinata]